MMIKAQLPKKYGFELTSDIQEIYQDESIDVIVELIGKIDPAKDFILGALAHKKHVVTANKDLLATHGPELTAAAKKPVLHCIMKPAWEAGFLSCEH